MRNLLFITLVLLLFACNEQQTEQSELPKYPKYETMLTEFFTSYTTEDIDSGYVKFEKRKEGWFVCVVGYDGNTDYIKNELFWDSKTQLYDKIDFSINKNPSSMESSISRYMRENIAEKFDIHSYYNYASWDWDIIGLLENKENLSDTALLSLAYAYSSYSNGLILGQYGSADASKKFDLPYGENSLNKAQLLEYRKYQHLAIEKFNKLVQQNSKFETIVGSIDDKASNEYITAFYNLLIFQNEEEARKELKDDLYSDFVIANAKNYLMSCRENAILFTNGDMDTYPLLYVQAQNNFRTDVKVINLSLLNIDRYIDFIQRETMGSKAVNISLRPTSYQGDSLTYIPIIDNPNIAALSLNELIMKIMSNDDAYKYSLSDDKKGTLCPTKNFTLNINKDQVSKNKIIELSEIDIVPNYIEFEAPQRYLIRSNIILLDILSNNNWERPIHFTTTMSKNSYLGLENYFQLEGLTYCLTPIKTRNDGYNFGRVNTGVLYDNLMNKFIWVDYSSGIDYSNKSGIRMGSQYRNYFSRLAATLIDENKNQKAEKVLDKCLALIPFDIVTYDFNTLGIIEAYYRLGKTEQAQKIFIAFYNIQKEVLNKHLSLSAEEQLDNRNEVRYNLYYIQSLYQLAVNHEDKATEQIMIDDDFEKYLR